MLGICMILQVLLMAGFPISIVYKVYYKSFNIDIHEL